LLIPNKPIFRQTEGEEYYIFFSRDTIKKASQKFLQNGNQSKSTLEHSETLEGLTLVESWLVEDVEKDKSRLYNLDVPVGTWMGAVKVDNDEIWNQYVKEGKVKGFSIEGYFADKYEQPQDKGIKEDMSIEHHSQELLEKIVSLFEKVNDDMAIIDDRLAYSTMEKAEEMAKAIGCEGHHVHDYEGKQWFMPCKSHAEEQELKEPCWAGYEMIGFKMKNGKKVPNCVPIKK
jgi:hypothetical protein